jgi:hypothetical protein
MSDEQSLLRASLINLFGKGAGFGRAGGEWFWEGHGFSRAAGGRKKCGL